MLEFCREDRSPTSFNPARPDLVGYVSDYFYGFNPGESSQMWYGIWVPGNGLNHSILPNTVYRTAEGGVELGIDLVALTDIYDGDEMLDDYRRHGSPPDWAAEFSEEFGVTMNFSGYNDFV
eukprot:TRINITY_DN9492_c0_g1_i3.p2 TRINITY_DN9492_c0_g1~~TRINITY_DN9492_c0_g1_i3.p2  ORF type:complete len:121 (-),score=18.09 TRINITY_DN9492_c0_g1_i3:98-460(-)